MKLGFRITLVCGLLMALSVRSASAVCIGDCGNRGAVGTDDLVTIVLIALDQAPLSRCPEADPTGDGVQITDVVASVQSSLVGCLEGTATPTTSAVVDTPTPTVVPPTAVATATSTEVPPTTAATPTNTEGAATPTSTEVPPTTAATPTNTEGAATPTSTEVPPTSAATPTTTEVPPTSAATPTNTEFPPTSTPTAIEAPATDTPSPTVTSTPEEPCPVLPGRYTVTQISLEAAGGPNCTPAEGGNPCPAGLICDDPGPGGDGLCHGTLKVDGGVPFAFPAGGAIIQEVSAASPPDCVHDVVIPFPGGFSAPPFCSVAAFGFSTSLDQIGCGRGYLDSNGGSDFTVKERGDTSAPNAPCFLTGPCTNGANNNIRVDLTLGDGVADTCPGGGTANSFVGIPVHTLTWQDVDGDCPDMDGKYDPGDDTLVTDFNQNLDFTTDASDADWEDLDPDGCCIRGSGPGATQSLNPPVCNTAPAGLAAAGKCMDLGAMTVTTAGTGMVGSTGAPLYDLTFASRLPSVITGPVAPTGATCPGFIIPPASGGTIIRCIP